MRLPQCLGWLAVLPDRCCGCRGESNDDVKSNLLTSIGDWLQLSSNCSPAVSSRLAACLTDKELLKNAALSAVLKVSLLHSQKPHVAYMHSAACRHKARVAAAGISSLMLLERVKQGMIVDCRTQLQHVHVSAD